MKPVRILPSAFLLLSLLAAATDQSNPADTEGFVVICPVDGMIDDGVTVIVERALEDAAGAKAVIFVVDTPGGRVDSAIDVSNAIIGAQVHTIAYVKGMGAVSAGALISLSCQDIIMAQEATIGAAAPVVMTPQGTLPTGEKEVSFMRSKMRALAERNGYNPDIAEAMVDKDIELWVRDTPDGKLETYASTPTAPAEADTPTGQAADPLETVVERIIETLEEKLPIQLDKLKKATKDLPDEKDDKEEVQEEEVQAAPSITPSDLGYRLVVGRGKLLTLSAQQALDLRLIDTTANNISEVMAFYGYYGLRRAEVEITWADDLFRWLIHPMVAGLLFMLGIGGLYFEVRTPGFGLPGIIGLSCLALFFGARAVLGLADWIDLLLVMVGLILLLLELFALPGVGIAGIAGVLCLLAGIYLALTRVAIPQYSWDFVRLQDAGLSLAVAMIALTVFVVATWKLLPHTPAYNWLVLSTAQEQTKGFVVQTAAQEAAALGQVGTALTMLRPAGRGRFGGKTYSVVSRAEFIEKGTPIVIVQAEGNRYVVDKAKEEA